MRKLCLVVWGVLLCLSGLSPATLIVDFDDLLPGQNISGSFYDEIFWNYSSQPGVYFKTGAWISHHYDPTGNDPDNNILTNSYGCTEITFQFPETNFPYGIIAFGAYFCGYGNENNWPAAITVTGFMDGSEVWSSSLYTVTADLQWLSMDSSVAVDYIAITVTPKDKYSSEFNEYGYFGMDNLAFSIEVIPEPATFVLLAVGVAAIRRRK